MRFRTTNYHKPLAPIRKQEIDYIEEYGGVFNAYEFKYNPKKKARMSKTFSNAYPSNKFTVINNENYDAFLR